MYTDVDGEGVETALRLPVPTMGMGWLVLPFGIEGFRNDVPLHAPLQ